MADSLEDKIQAGANNEPKKPQGIIESVTNELGDLVNLSIGAMAPVAGFALTGNAGVIATSASYVAATKGKKDSKIIRNESLTGALFGTFAHYTTLPLRGLSAMAKAAYMIPWVFGANAFYMGIDHLVKEKTFKGLYTKFKEKYIPIVKKAFTLPAPLNILAAVFLPIQYMVFSNAVTSYLFRRFVVGGKGEEYEDKRPYVVAASSALGRGLKNIFYEAPQVFYSIGSSITGKYSKPVTSPAPTHGQ